MRSIRLGDFCAGRLNPSDARGQFLAFARHMGADASSLVVRDPSMESVLLPVVAHVGTKPPAAQTVLCKHFKLHLLPAIESGGVRVVRNGRRARYREKAMASRMNQRPKGSVNPGQLAALLDKLVAVQMDLEPVCGVGKERARVVASLESIAEACEILRSAIADVRSIVYDCNALQDRPEAMYG